MTKEIKDLFPWKRERVIEIAQGIIDEIERRKSKAQEESSRISVDAIDIKRMFSSGEPYLVYERSAESCVQDFIWHLLDLIRYAESQDGENVYLSSETIELLTDESILPKYLPDYSEPEKDPLSWRVIDFIFDRILPLVLGSIIVVLIVAAIVFLSANAG